MDAGTTHNTRYVAKEPSRREFKPLTDAECADLMAKRACFRCRKPRHVSWNCYSCCGPETVNVGTTARDPPSRESGPQKQTLESFGGIKGLYEHLAEHGTEAEKEAFIDACQDF